MTRSTRRTDDVPHVLDPAGRESSDDGQPPELGLRVVSQSEGERFEAADFLIATRAQEEVRRRVARAAMAVRDDGRVTLATAIHERPDD